jgi:type IV pilus biogenesis protein CpaD/CtpE
MKLFPNILLVAAIFALGACNAYLERKDTITFSAGDAVASNAAVQIGDPWPRNSQNANIPMDGVKAQSAIERYRDGANGGGPVNGGRNMANAFPTATAGRQ